MIKVEVKDGVCSFSGEGNGIGMVMECLVIAASLSQHLASENPTLASMYEYLLTKGVKDGTLFDAMSEAMGFEFFKGTPEEFLKGAEGDLPFN